MDTIVATKRTHDASAAPAPTELVSRFVPLIEAAHGKHDAPVTVYPKNIQPYRFWRPNSAAVTWCLVVDCDKPDSLVHLLFSGLPKPSWVIEKTENGHGQAGWVIEEVSTAADSRITPQDFARDVRQALTLATGSDTNFTNTRCWNPLWEGWKAGVGRVFWGHTEPRSLGDLRAALVESGLWETTAETAAPPISRPRPAQGHAAEGSRNRFVFDFARLRSFGTVAEAAHTANALCAPLLPENEVAGIIRSVERYEARRGRSTASGGGHVMSDEMRALLAENGRRGGSRHTEAQQDALAMGSAAGVVVRQTEAVGRAAMAVHLSEIEGLSAQQIADRLGCSRDTVRRALREHRKTL